MLNHEQKALVGADVIEIRSAIKALDLAASHVKVLRRIHDILSEDLASLSTRELLIMSILQTLAEEG